MSNIRLIFGFHAITSRLRQNPRSVKEIFLDSTRRDKRARNLIKLAETRKIHLILCDGTRLDAMSGGVHHQGVGANIDTTYNYIDIEDVLEALTDPALFLILDGVQDPHNLGACLRVADAFGADAIYAGQPRYSMRARNNGFGMEQLCTGILEAHSLGKKFFVASNIAPHNAKIKTFINDMSPVIHLKPDALIMSDPGLIMMVREKWPEIPIHLSVQANTVNFAGVKD